MTRNKWLIVGAIGSVVAACFICMACLVLYVAISPQLRSNGVADSLSPTQIPNPTSTRATVATQTTVSTPAIAKSPTITVTLSPESAFGNLAIASGKDYNLILNIPTKIENGTATAEYKLNTDLYNEESILRSATLTFRDLAPATFKTFPQVTTLLTGVMVPFKDTYGNTKLDTGVMFRMTRTTADKMNWATYSSFNLDKILTGKGDLFYIADPLLTTWKRLAK